MNAVSVFVKVVQRVPPDDQTPVTRAPDGLPSELLRIARCPR